MIIYIFFLTTVTKRVFLFQLSRATAKELHKENNNVRQGSFHTLQEGAVDPWVGQRDNLTAALSWQGWT